MTKNTRLAGILMAAHLFGSAWAQQDGAMATEPASKLHLQVSPYTVHYGNDPDYKPIWMVGLERELVSGKLDGVAFFSNSFGQECVYLYPWGQTYHGIAGIQPLSFKWTAGLLYGYKAPYEDKVPLNYRGFSPGAIVALEYHFKPGWSAQVDLLGTAGLMFQVNMVLR